MNKINYLIERINFQKEKREIAKAKEKIEFMNYIAVKGLEETMKYIKGTVRIFNQQEKIDNWKDCIEQIKQTNKPYPRN